MTHNSFYNDGVEERKKGTIKKPPPIAFVINMFRLNRVNSGHRASVQRLVFIAHARTTQPIEII